MFYQAWGVAFKRGSIATMARSETALTAAPRALRSNASPGARLLTAWKRLSPWPGGRRLFSRVVGWQVPYTGSLGARIVELRPGYARLELRERRSLRNHLRSVHAVALMNLGEATSGLSMLAGLPSSLRGIVTELSAEYLKKARGSLVAECACEPPATAGKCRVRAEIRDTAGDMVAVVTATWLVSSGSSRGAARPDAGAS